MTYSTLQVGVTGPAGRIGAGTEYHIDTKFSDTLSWDQIRDRFDALATRYRDEGRNVEFSNQGVGGLVYNLDATPEERIKLLQQVAGAHAPRSGWHSFDYYAPTIGNNRFHSSAEGAPIYVVGQSGRKSKGGTGGGYGNYGYVLDENGNVVSKTGHGDTQGTAFAGGTFGGGSAPTATSKPEDTPPIVEAKERATSYKEMNKSQLNAEYDKLRASDPAKAAAEGMKMHKAYFGKK